LARNILARNVNVPNPAETPDIEGVVANLAAIGESAPDSFARQAIMAVGEGLRGLGFANEAVHLLRQGGRAPTGDELAQADAARRGALARLDEALSVLHRRLGEGTITTQAASGPGPT
jgi:hypothetical protein